jgi:hypothetical protein
MSYADRIRAELCEVTVKKPCCERALLLGLFADAVRSEKALTLTLRGEEIADFAEAVMKNASKTPTLCAKASRLAVAACADLR